MDKEQRAALARAIGEECEVHCDAVHDLLAALNKAEAKQAQLRKALLLYVDEFAGIHDEDCPEDYTCTCEKVRLIEDALKED